MKMMKLFMVVMDRKRANLSKAMQMAGRRNTKTMARCFHRVLKMNEFERNWLFDVRYEVHFKEIMQAQFDALRLHVKYSKTKRSLNQNRCFHFFLQCRELVEKSQQKVDTIRQKFGRRLLRHMFKVLRLRVASQQRKRNAR